MVGWYYRDSAGASQGPIEEYRIRELYEHGHLSLLVELAQEPTGPFQRLSDWFPDLVLKQQEQRGEIQNQTRNVAASGLTSSSSSGATSQQGSSNSPPSTFYAASRIFSPSSVTHGGQSFSFASFSGAAKNLRSKGDKGRDTNGSVSGGGAGPGSSSKTNSVKNKFLSRVTRHRRSSSAGSNPENGVVLDVRQLQQLQVDREGDVSTPAASPWSPKHQSSQKTFERTKLKGKKLLSVVTAPRYPGIKYSKYGRGFISLGSGSGKDKDLTAATGGSTNAKKGKSKSRRPQVPSFPKTSRYRNLYMRKRGRRKKKGKKDATSEQDLLRAEQHSVGQGGGLIVADEEDAELTAEGEEDDEGIWGKAGEEEEEEDDDDDDDLDDDDDEEEDDDDDDDDDDVEEEDYSSSSDEELEYSDIYTSDNANRVLSDNDRRDSSLNDDEDEDAEFHETASTSYGTPSPDLKPIPSFHFAKVGQEGIQPPALSDEKMTEELYKLLGTYEVKGKNASPSLTASSAKGAVAGRVYASSDTSFSEPLSLYVSELQSENSQLRAQIRWLRSVISERLPGFDLPADPACPSIFHADVSSNKSTRGRTTSQAAGSASASKAAAAAASPEYLMASGGFHHARSASCSASLPSTSFGKNAAPPSPSPAPLHHGGVSPGPSSAAVQAAQDSDEWEDFVTVEFDEDSPNLRRKTHEHAENIEQLRSEMRVLLKTSHAFLHASGDASERWGLLAEGFYKPEIREVDPVMKRFANVLVDLTKIKEVLLDSVDSNVRLTIEAFLHDDVKRFQSLRRDLQRAREHYESLDHKYMLHRRHKSTRPSSAIMAMNVAGKGHDAVEEAMYEDLQSAKARFELARFGFIQQLNTLETKKRCVLAARVANCMHDFLQVFRFSYQRLAAESAFIDQVRAAHAGSEARLRMMEGKWTEKQQQLTLQLHSGHFPYMSKERRKTAPSRKVVIRSRLSRSSLDPDILHQGYLYKRTTNVRKDWKRRWFVLRHDCLVYYRGWKDTEAQDVCDILLCTVREAKNPDLKCCFEVISPNNRAYVLQASNEAEMNTWIDAIRKAIEAKLAQTPATTTSPGGRPSLSRSSGLADHEVALLLSKNPHCADCNTPKPDWVSLNLGVLICITCSGIHRSLGTHISKVRSIALDRLSRTQLQLLRRLGNQSTNLVLEAALPHGAKPTPESPRGVRETFIQDKYVHKRFMRLLGDDDDDDDGPLNAPNGIFDAISANDIERLAHLLFQHKDSVDKVYDVSDPKGDNEPRNTTPLHYATKLGLVDAVELLLLNGARLDAVDDNGERPIDLACRLDIANVLDVFDRYAPQSGGSPLSSDQQRRETATH